MKLKYPKLDLGCADKKPDGYIGVDIIYFKYPKGEFVRADINYRLPFADESFNLIQAIATIEHIDNNRKVAFMNEMSRLLKAGGSFTAVFPPPICKDGIPNPNFFTDPTHNAWWMPGTFYCFDKAWREQAINRETYEKSYGINTNFKLGKFWWMDNFELHIEMIKLCT